MTEIIRLVAAGIVAVAVAVAGLELALVLLRRGRDDFESSISD